MNALLFYFIISALLFSACNNATVAEPECLLYIQNADSFAEESICECPYSYIQSGSYCLLNTSYALFKTIKHNCPCDLINVSAEIKIFDDSTKAQLLIYSDWIQVFDLMHSEDDLLHSFETSQSHFFDCNFGTKKICIQGWSNKRMDTLWLSLNSGSSYNCTDSNICKMTLRKKL
ncbi:MAG: hypothetical protein HKN22_08100 [Bacteroidia bacterium]|nr:hypothetical protein [Bacteroidia bacterium]